KDERDAQSSLLGSFRPSDPWGGPAGSKRSPQLMLWRPATVPGLTERSKVERTNLGTIVIDTPPGAWGQMGQRLGRIVIHASLVVGRHRGQRLGAVIIRTPAMASTPLGWRSRKVPVPAIEEQVGLAGMSTGDAQKQDGQTAYGLHGQRLLSELDDSIIAP